MRSIIGALALVLLLGAGAGITGAAQPGPPSTIRAGAVGWLRAQVSAQGALISPYTSNPDAGMTAQAVLALAGAGAGSSVTTPMIGYLEAHVSDYVHAGSADDPGALAWLILDAVATGGDPSDFGGVDLVQRLEATQRSAPGSADDGLFGAADPTYDGVFRQSLALVALGAVGTPNPRGLAWLEGQQCADGGFVAYRSDVAVPCPAVDPTTFSGEDTNSTALGAIALHDAGDRPGGARAVARLAAVRTGGGGFAYLADPTQEMDGNSTGLALLAFTTVNGNSDAGSVAALGSLQVPDSAGAADRGGIAFQPQAGVLYPDLMATTQALLGLSGRALPFVPQPVPSTSVPPTTPSPGPSSSSAPAPTTPTAAPARPVAGTPSYTG